MDIYILNKSLERIGVIDTYNSLLWVKRYYSAGDFELYIPADASALELLKEDYYLQRDDDDRVMIIEDIELKTDAEQGDYITVAGRSLESILARRIVWQQTTLNDTAENAIRQIIDENCINPEQAGRIIRRLQLSDANGFTETIEQQLTGDNIAEWLETVCTAYGYGWRICLEDGNFIFYLYKGKDRTYGNEENNPFVVFSPEFDNLVNSDYKKSKQNFKNAALILGEGEGTARARAEIGDAADLDRYELYVDARDVSSNSGEISAAEYGNLLTERGKQKLSEQATTEGFDGEIDADGVYVYKQNFDIGDIIQIENEYGITATARIIEIIESEDENGKKIVPTLATWELPKKILIDAEGYVITDSTGAIITV